MSRNDDSVFSIIKKPQYNIVFRDPESVLKSRLGNDISVVEFKNELFLKFGDNYMSTMMKITISVRKTEEKVEKLELIGKMLPSTDIQRDFMEIVHTFQKEIFFYDQLLPAYQKIYKKEYYESRTSLKPSTDELTDDAIILLDNLKAKGYYLVDRHKGLDLEHLSVLIPAIAKFHAIGLSVKYKKPSFLPILEKHNRRIVLPNVANIFIKKLLGEMDNHPDLSQYHARLKALYHNPKILDYFYNKTLDLKDSWACVAHLDLWNNNILFHRAKNGKVDDVKIVDFQAYAVNSPLRDLVFLLGSSMEYPMEHFDRMLEFYRQSVYEVLEELELDGCLFEKQEFEERFKIDAITEIFHLIIGTIVVELCEREDIQVEPSSEFTLRKLKRVCEVFEQKKWF